MLNLNSLLGLKLVEEIRRKSADDIEARSTDCKKAGYQAVTYSSMSEPSEALQTECVHIITMTLSKNPLFINTILLGGTTEQKINAALNAGFDQVELWQQDVEQCTDKQVLTRIGFTDYQVLLDFDGAPDKIRGTKRRQALAMLETASQFGVDTLLVPASTDKNCIAGRVEEDLRWLAEQAARKKMRIAYEAMSWSSVYNSSADAWRLIKRIDLTNLGMVVDAFHLFVLGRDVSDLATIPMEKIFLVQLSDLDEIPGSDSLIATARHKRLLPGEGHFPLPSLLNYLKASKYNGPIGLEVFNDELKARKPMDVAIKSMESLKRICY